MGGGKPGKRQLSVQQKLYLRHDPAAYRMRPLYNHMEIGEPGLVINWVRGVVQGNTANHGFEPCTDSRDNRTSAQAQARTLQALSELR